MDDITIRTIEAQEYDALTEAMASAFSESTEGGWVEADRPLLEPDRTFAASEDDRFVGGTFVNTLRMTIPGGDVPIAGITGVGVAQSHRRRGVASALLRAAIDQVHQRGEAVAVLHASEGGIYERFGFAVSSLIGTIDIERDRAALTDPPSDPGRVRLFARPEAFSALRPVWNAARSTQTGMLARDADAWWEARFFDPKDEREGASPFFFALHEGPDGPDAYAVYRFKHEWPDQLPSGRVTVEELIGATSEGLADIWRFVSDVDLAARIQATVPVDTPLLHMLREPRRARLRVRDGLLVRLVDVPAALAARAYATPGRVVIDVRDAFCPWNEGRYLVDADSSAATCTPTDAPPDLQLDENALAAAYFGGISLARLADARMVTELTPGSLDRAAVMFGWPRAPWSPEVF